MSSTNSTVIEQVDKDIELAHLVRDDSELPQLVIADPNTSPLLVINTSSTLSTHHIPLRTHTLPPAYDPDPCSSDSNNQTIASRGRATLPTRLTERTWFLHIERYASVVGLVIAVVALGVTVVGIIIGVIVAVLVR